MQLHPYVVQVQSQLNVAAALGDDRTRETAGALAVAAEPAMRLAVLAAVAAAAEEITVALLDAPGAPAIGVRLDGDELRIDVHTSVDDDGPAAPSDDGDASARISLRLSEALKSEIETAARRDSASVNTWLIRAAGAALGGSPRRSSGHPDPGRHDTHRISGWING